MKVLKIAALISLVLLMGLFLWSCAGQSSAQAAAAQAQTAAVQKGDLTISITSAGNLALSLTADPAFEISGTVREVLVQEGDSVKKGQALARLDPSDWQDQVYNLETQLISAQRQLTSKKSAILQSQISLLNARMTLEQAQEPTSSKGQDTSPILDPLDIQIKSMQLNLARANLTDAQAGVADVQRAVDAAQKAYNDAKNASPEVLAPFDGFITKVSVTGGLQIYKGQVAVSMADPTKFEAQLLVGEVDIFKIAIGTPANVGIDAVSGLTVPAKVTKVAPTATVQGNVVNYSVKVELDPTQVLQLKQGLSVTVNVIVQNKQSVLMVPNRAIINQGKDTVVQIAGTDPPEMRPVKLGISDYQNTEVTDGLKEGEKVVVPQAAAGTTSSSQQRTTTGTIGGIPGIGRIVGGGR